MKIPPAFIIDQLKGEREKRQCEQADARACPPQRRTAMTFYNALTSHRSRDPEGRWRMRSKSVWSGVASVLIGVTVANAQHRFHQIAQPRTCAS